MIITRTTIFAHLLLFFQAASSVTNAHAQQAAFSNSIDDPLGTEEDKTWTEKYGRQIDLPFSGPLAFSHLPYHRCLDQSNVLFDIAVLGMPFDTAVTYRPGWVLTGS
jgi:agmatinase